MYDKIGEPTKVQINVFAILEVLVVAVKLFGLELVPKNLMEELFEPLDLLKNILMAK